MASSAGRPPRRRLKPQPLSNDLLIEDDIETEASVAGNGRDHILQQAGGGRRPLATVRVSQKLANETNSQRPSSLPSISGRPVGREPPTSSVFTSHDRLPAIPAGRGADWPPPLAEGPPALEAESPPLASLQRPLAESSDPASAAGVQEPLHSVQEPPHTVQDASPADVQEPPEGVQELTPPADEQECSAEPAQLVPPAKLSLDKPWWHGVSKQQLLALKSAKPPTPETKPKENSPPPTPAPESPPSPASPVQLVAPLPLATLRRWSKEPITELQVQALRRVLFGDPNSRFSPDWVSQGFHFGNASLPYLLCSSRLETRAALCAVQAELLVQLLFAKAAARRLRVAGAVRSAALAAAVCAIVSRCGQPIRVVLPNAAGERYVESLDFQRDGVSETLDVYKFNDQAAAAEFLADSIACFERQRTPALLLLLYSCLLTLGADSPQYTLPLGSEAPLLGADNLSSSGLLALLLCGQPVQQVFNDSEVAADGRPVAGVPRRCTAGALSRREFASRRSREPYSLGSFLKSPASPVWLLLTGDAGDCCVAFTAERKLVSDWRAERHFQLQLVSPTLRAAAADTVVVDCRDRLSPPPAPRGGEDSDADDEEAEGQQLHAVQMCLLSKWPDAKVELLSSNSCS